MAMYSDFIDSCNIFGLIDADLAIQDTQTNGLSCQGVQHYTIGPKVRASNLLCVEQLSHHAMVCYHIANRLG